MTIDKYTKFLLTLIAVGIIGINFHLFKGSVVKDAFAASEQVHKIAICREDGGACAYVSNKSWQGESKLYLNIDICVSVPTSFRRIGVVSYTLF